MLRSCHALLLLVVVASPLFASSDLSGTIASNTTLTRAGGPYNLTGDLVISAGVIVSLDPGVQIIAQGDYSVFVYGTLQGAGTSTLGIVLRGALATGRGVWEGVYVAASGHLDLHYVTIKGAASDVLCSGGTIALANCNLLLAAEDGLNAWNAANVQLAACRMASNGRRGVTIEGYQATGRISSCEFRANGGYPVRLKATLVEMLKGGNRYYGNGTQRIGVSCSLSDDITDEDFWTRQTVPFELGAEETGQRLNIAAGGRLVIPAGTLVLCEPIDCRGRLDINGLAGSPCQLRPHSALPQPGDWDGITFYPGSTGVIRMTTVSDADTAVTADGATLSMTDSALRDSLYDGARLTGNTALTLLRDTFSGSGRNGLRLDGPALTGSVSGCSFRSNHSYPLWSLARNLTLVGSANTYSGDTIERLAVSCGGNPDLPSGVHTWLPQGVPLDLTVNATGATLNVAPAATLNLTGGQTLYLGGLIVKGTLNADGATGTPLRFLPPLSSSRWNGLQFDGGSGRLSRVVITGAVTGVNLLNASPAIRESSFTGSQYDGLACAGSSSPIVTDTEFTGNGRHGVYVTGTALPNLGDLTNASRLDNGRNTLSGNGGYDLCNDTVNTLRAQNNIWLSADEAVIRTRIFDHADLASRGAVVFSPVFAAPANTAPALFFAGAAGYENSGVQPQLGPPSQPFVFKIKYLDVDDLPPASVQVHIATNGQELPQSPLELTAEAEPDYATGAVFSRRVTLPAGRQYTYWFGASDGLAVATGAPTTPLAGPIANSAPGLTWTGQTNYETDGVDPSAGSSATVFTFRCRYKDVDGDAPTGVLCHVLNSGGAEIGDSPVAMAATDANLYTRGRGFQTRMTLPAGSYSYYFSSADGVSAARGIATLTTVGPTVSAGASAAVVALSVVPSRLGDIAIRWTQMCASRVDIRVLNLAGRLVSTVVSDRVTPAGARQILWSPCSASGRRLASGTYLLVLEAHRTDGTQLRLLSPFQLR